MGTRDRHQFLSPERQALARLALASGCLVFACAWVGIDLTRGPQHVATIWFANAVLVRILLGRRPRDWSAIVVCAYVGNVLATIANGIALPLALGLAACNTFEILIVVVGLHRWSAGAFDVLRLPHLGLFCLIAGVVAPAGAGAVAAYVIRYGAPASSIAVWAAWALAHALGNLVFTPLLVMLRLAEIRDLLRPARRLETLVWTAALLAVTSGVFYQAQYPLLFLPMAMLGVLAARLGAAGTAVGIVIVAVAATASTVGGYGPMMLVPVDLAARVLVVQGFIASIVLSKLPLLAILSDSRRFQAQAREANRQLLLAEKIAQVGHWRLRVDTHEVMWSEGVYRMYGVDPATYTPTLEDAVASYHPDERAGVMRTIQQAIETGTGYESSRHLVRPDGQTRNIVLRGLCETDTDGKVTSIFGTIIDVTELRQAERAVVESEARYRLLADNTTDMVTQMDLTGRRLFVSPGSRALLGYEPEELIGTHPQVTTHPDDIAGVKQKLADLAASNLDRTLNVNRLRHKDGHWIWVEASVTLLRDDSGRPSGFVTAIRNITDRKLANDALQESEARYRLLADHSSDLIALKPTFAGPRSYVSPSSLGMMGYEPDELAALPASDYIHPDDQARVAAEFASLTTNTPQVTSMHRLKHKSGRWLWCEVDFRLTNTGRPDQSVIVRARDVTARWEAEQALAASESRYRLLADNGSDLIVLGHADGRRSYVSPAVRPMLGYSVDEARRLTMREWIHPDDLTAVFATTQGLSRERPMASVTYRLKHRAGHYIWAEAAFQRVEDGDDIRIITAIRDVTERVQQANQLRAAKAAAEAGAQIKAEFLANMSHELRTPLTGMLGVHDLLQNDPALDDRQRHLVELAQSSGRALLAIVNDVLDFSKVEAGQMTIEHVPFSLRELIDGCLQLCRQTIKLKPVALAAEIDASVPDSVVGDPTRVRQILLNLVSNAIKFTREGQVTIRSTWADGLAKIDVIDTGIGISAEHLPRLFERFIQADGSTGRHFGGTGLGLSISKRLVELMDGAIGVDSRVGIGSRFWLTLPLATITQESRLASGPGAAPATSTIGRRILVAEDNEINQEIIRTILTQKGHLVTMVGDGEAAILAFKTAVFDVVLMDVQMPGTDGLAATLAIRGWEAIEGRRSTPIVALTANAMAEESERCRRAGMNGHVAKPIEWAQLFATIERLCVAPDVGPRVSAPDEVQSPIFDERALDGLAEILGRDRIVHLLALFQRDTEVRLKLLEQSAATAEDLAFHAHAFIAHAGQLGFLELSMLCAELQELSLTGGGLDRLSALNAAARRALAAASTSAYARAA